MSGSNLRIGKVFLLISLILVSVLFTSIAFAFNTDDFSFHQYYLETGVLTDYSVNPYFLIKNLTSDIFKVDHQSNFYFYQYQSCTLKTDGDGKLSCGSDIDSNAGTICDAGAYLDGDTSCYDFNSSVSDLLETTYFNVATYSMVAGSVLGGSISDVNHVDGAYDGVTFNFGEATGSPALDIQLNFTGISNFNKGFMRYKTSSLSGDLPIIQVWNYDSGSWEDYPSLVSTDSFVVIDRSVFNPSSHLQDGIVQMRLYKSSNGNSNNKYYVDWIAIADGVGTPSGQETDPYAVHRDGSLSLSDNWDAGSFNISAYGFSALDWSNVSISESQISDLSDGVWSIDGDTIVNSSGSLAVGSDSIGNDELEFNTGQALTTTSNVVFNKVNISDDLYLQDKIYGLQNTASFWQIDNLKFTYTGNSKEFVRFDNSFQYESIFNYNNEDIDFVVNYDDGAAMSIDGAHGGVLFLRNVSFKGNVTVPSLDTGQGFNELYAMNQDVETTDDVVFNNVTASDSVLTTVLILNKTANMCIMQNGTDILIVNNVSGVNC